MTWLDYCRVLSFQRNLLTYSHSTQTSLTTRSLFNTRCSSSPSKHFMVSPPCIFLISSIPTVRPSSHTTIFWYCSAIIPRHKLASFDGRAFCVSAPTLWNSIPKHICDLSLQDFKTHLKTYIFLSYFSDLWMYDLVHAMYFMLICIVVLSTVMFICYDIVKRPWVCRKALYKINFIIKLLLLLLLLQPEFRKCWDVFLSLNKMKTKRLSNHMSQYFIHNRT